jgi:hypothetical protein
VGWFLDEMRLKPWLDSKNLVVIAIARPITGHDTAAALRRFASIQTRNSRGVI